MRDIEKDSMYKIPLKGLKVGVYEYDFTLDNEFFNLFSETRDTIASLKATVKLEKTELLMTLIINLEGHYQAICDRCLDTFDMPFLAESKFFVKNGDKNEELSDDLLILSNDSDFIDLKDTFYEMFQLNLPLRTIHPEINGESTCNEQMIEELEGYIPEPEEKKDPRWAELKKLINN